MHYLTLGLHTFDTNSTITWAMQCSLLISAVPTTARSMRSEHTRWLTNMATRVSFATPFVKVPVLSNTTVVICEKHFDWCTGDCTCRTEFITIVVGENRATFVIIGITVFSNTLEGQQECLASVQENYRKRLKWYGHVSIMKRSTSRE